ncbi:M61 family metallopeptidase [Terriglobus aquaticus]|uniref:M61 family peptidase n=1 Tax=Terriglobus aquaticus TaxID=940139 RepID=A0ABW9KGV1_9BACT|nr:M61 family peptidase [Terriglobus aquaticus]
MLPVVALAVSCVVLSAAVAAQQTSTAIQIHLDLREAPRKIVRADVDLPVAAGAGAQTVDLITPEWIPGAHGPRGPVTDIVGLRFEAGGQVLKWHRDPVNVYEYHVEVPAGVAAIHAHLDSLDTRNVNGTYAAFEWNGVLLYPAHVPVRQIAIQPTVTLPAGWGVGTSLHPLAAADSNQAAGGTVKYAATTVELLQDSPVMAGKFFHEYALSSGTPLPHFLDVVGPTAASVQVSAEALAKMSHLLREGIAMYGPPHYTQYHFLVLMKNGGGGGLEHHESSDNTVPLSFFKEYDPEVGTSGILAHEFTHSWNGKFRRPDGLATPDYATPMQNNLLWVYEGLTNYLGDVLAERTGVMTAAQYRQELALTLAQQDAQSGRAWRSVEDTTFIDAMPRGGRGSSWSSWKRGTDYYPEGSIFWLDVDTTIRKLTGDKKSLRDFLLLFLQAGKPGEVRVEPYSLDEVVRDLNAVAPNDWAGFVQTRLYDVQPRVNVEGVEQAGWRLEYTPEPTPEMAVVAAEDPSMAAWFSIGLSVGTDGAIGDVGVGSAADKAGLAPDQKVVAVNGKVFTLAVLNTALRSAGTLQLTVQEGDALSVVPVSAAQGLRYPRLTRVQGTPDRMEEILKPVTR